MPAAFFAMSWDPDTSEAAAHADRIRARLLKAPDRPRCLETPGFLLADLSAPAPGSAAILDLRRPDGQSGGAIFGTLFPRSGSKRLRDMPIAASVSLSETGGRALYRDYWGSYVAFLRIGNDLAICTDPVSSIPCFYSTECGVTCVYSNLELCPFLDRSRFSLNLRVITTLMAYDKIQNGETGLNEVRELLGGQRLMARTPGTPPDTLWDPHEIAQDGFEPDPLGAAHLLRDTVEQAVGAWASCAAAPAVDLSGGLDSSIVLACAAHSKAAPPLLAVHHVLESGDPSELAYARAVAAFLGADLAEIRVTPSDSLPSADLHPPSARPYRQFLARDFNIRLAESAGGASRTYLTGQGGDHLFHAARTPFGFVDHVRRHGLGSRTFSELASAARLSARRCPASTGMLVAPPLRACRGDVAGVPASAPAPARRDV